MQPQASSYAGPAGSLNDPNKIAALQAGNIESPTQSSWWQRLLPTAGAILGGLVPIPGLDIATAGLGAAAGKAAENAMSGKPAIEGSDLTAGLQGAAGQGVGNILGGVLGKVMGTGSKLADTGATKLVQGQFKGTLDATTAKALTDMGITDARQIEQIAPLITQGNGALSTGVKEALATAAESGEAGVDITGLDKVAQNMLAEHGVAPRTIDTVSGNLTSSINNMINPEDIVKAVNKRGLPTYSYAEGSLTHALPENVFKQSQKMDQLASQAYTKAYDKMGNVVNAEELAKAQTYSKLGDELESRAFGTSGGSPLQLSQEAKDAIIKKLEPVKAINPDTYNHYVAAVSKADTVQELRPLQSSMVNASKALQGTQQLTARTGGISTGDIARGTIGLAKSPKAGIAGMAISSPTADRGAASVLANLSKVAGDQNAQKIVKQLARVGAITAATSPNLVSQPSSIPPLGGTINSAIPGQGVGMQGQPESEFNNVIQSLMQAMMLDPNQFAGAGSNVIGAAMPQLIKTAQGQAMLPGLLAAFQNAGGAQGMGGIFSRATGLIPGTPQAALNAQSGQVANTLGVSPGMVPNVMQTPGTAGIQGGTLQAIIQALGGGQPAALPVQ